MLSRRQVLFSAAGGIVPLVLTRVLSGCGSSSAAETNPTPLECDGALQTSTQVQGHAHTVCVPALDLDTPPAAGVIYTSSNDGGHTHRVPMTAAELTAVAQGQIVSVPTSSAEGHAHAFAVERRVTPPPEPTSEAI